MDDKNVLIAIDDAEGHQFQGVVAPQDTGWIEERLRSDAGIGSLRIQPDEADDVEGSALLGATTVRVYVTPDDDVEGHAISVQFPSRADADAFRKRLMLTGALVGSVALGAVGGTALSSLQQDSDAGSLTSAANQGYTERLDEMAATTQAGQGANLGNAATLDQIAATTQSSAQSSTQRLDEMAATTQSGAAAGQAANEAWQEASAATAARESGITQTQTGPMDAHEAPAFQAQSAAANEAWQEASAATAARESGTTQTGPMDAHEAPAFQDRAAADQSTQRLDEMAATTQSDAASSTSDDDDASEIPGLGPR